MIQQRMNRRILMAAALAGAAPRVLPALAQLTPAVEVADRLVFDLLSEPANIHPARAYSDIEWSVVHSIFDAVIGFDAEGAIRPVAAARFDLIDDLTWEIELRPGMTFHDGSAVDASAIVRGFDLVSGGDSLVSDIFSVVERIDIVDDLTARMVVSAPSPWLPAQMASWHVLAPEGFDTESPVGSGPYAFVSWDHGQQLSLRRHADYQPSSTKGTPIADVVVYRFVPDATTRTSDVLSGEADVATFMPLDSLPALESGGIEPRQMAVAGSWFIRIATDTPPFDDVRVRTALNMALDLNAFVGALVPEGSARLATVQPGPVSMGFDPDLAPFAYDPEASRSMLAEAGQENLSVTLELTSDSSTAVAEAIAAQWAEVGIAASVVISDIGTFNSGWTDAAAAPLRMASWSPLFDPSTLLGFVWQTDGLLSRYSNEAVDDVLVAAAGEMNADTRAELLRQAGNELHDDAAAVFLWNLVNVSGINARAQAWSPRPDQWVLPLNR